MNKIVRNLKEQHPIDSFFCTDSVPSVWCPGCGIGTVVYTFIEAVKEAKIDPNKICVISGIGCTGKIPEYLKFKSYNVIEDNVINYAANLKNEIASSLNKSGACNDMVEDTGSKVVVFTNNADFLLSGVKDFLEAGEKNANLLVLHINNFIYNINENEVIPISPFMRSSFNKEFELPFNIPHLAKSSGAVYVARWTPLQAGWLKYSIIDTFSKKGFSVIEVISPCVIYDTTNKRIGDAVDQMKFYSDNSIIKQDEAVENLDIRLQTKIIVGKFVDKKEN